MGRAETYLIPARFAITTGHFLAVLVLYYHMVSCQQIVDRSSRVLETEAKIANHLAFT